MVFEMLQVFENEPLRLACWVTTLYPGLQIFSFKVNSFNVIHYLCRAAKRAYPLFVALRFVSNAEQALSLTTNKGEDTRDWINIRRLFLDDWLCRECNLELVSLGHLVTAAERQHKICGLDLALDSVFCANTLVMCIKKVGQLRPLRNLMLNYWLDILLFLVSVVLPLNIFNKAAAKVVSSVLFRDNIATSALSTIDCCGKTLDFCLDICPLDLVGLSLQLLSLLL